MPTSVEPYTSVPSLTIKYHKLDLKTDACAIRQFTLVHYTLSPLSNIWELIMPTSVDPYSSVPSLKVNNYKLAFELGKSFYLSMLYYETLSFLSYIWELIMSTGGLRLIYTSDLRGRFWINLVCLF